MGTTNGMEGIKSKDRIQKYGEVFTPDNIVNDMLDLVDKEMDKNDIWGYIDKTFLEPACGNGNFLVRIVDRKLEAVQRLPLDKQEIGLMHALSSIYGIDIQQDNVEESRERMLNLIKTGSTQVLYNNDTDKRIEWHFKAINLTPELEKSVQEILKANIQQGNFLTGKKHEGTKATEDELLLTEYIWDGNNVKRNLIPLENLKEDSILKDTPVHTIDFTSYLNLDNTEELEDEELESW